MMIKKIVALALVVQICACSSVTIRPDGGLKDSNEPTYRESMPFYVWGLRGEHRVDVNEICEGAEVMQMQTVMAPSDYMISMLTLFFYSPRTVKVWCREEV